MFIGLSKTFAKFGGFRLGLGLRVTKNNAIWMLFIMLFVLVFQMTWYMMVLCFWLLYAICYGFVWCIKSFIRMLKKRGEAIDRSK